MLTLKRKVVGALLVSRDNCLLLGYKAPGIGGDYVDCWVLPGGGIEPGESDIEALRREVMEETGIDIQGFTTRLIEDTLTGETVKRNKQTNELTRYQMQFFDYLVEVPFPAQGISFKVSDDLTKLAWVSKEKLPDYKLSDSLRELLERHSPFEG